MTVRIQARAAPSVVIGSSFSSPPITNALGGVVSQGRAAAQVGNALQRTGGQIADFAIQEGEIAVAKAKADAITNYGPKLKELQLKINTDYLQRKGLEAQGMTNDFAEFTNDFIGEFEFEGETQERAVLELMVPFIDQALGALSRHEGKQVELGKHASAIQLIKTNRGLAGELFAMDQDAVSTLELSTTEAALVVARGLSEEAQQSVVAEEISSLYKTAIISAMIEDPVLAEEHLERAKEAGKLIQSDEDDLSTIVQKNVRDREVRIGVEGALGLIDQGMSPKEARRKGEGQFGRDEEQRDAFRREFDAELSNQATMVRGQNKFTNAELMNSLIQLEQNEPGFHTEYGQILAALQGSTPAETKRLQDEAARIYRAKITGNRLVNDPGVEANLLLLMNEEPGTFEKLDMSEFRGSLEPDTYEEYRLSQSDRKTRVYVEKVQPTARFRTKLEAAAIFNSGDSKAQFNKAMDFFQTELRQNREALGRPLTQPDVDAIVGRFFMEEVTPPSQFGPFINLPFTGGTSVSGIEALTQDAPDLPNLNVDIEGRPELNVPAGDTVFRNFSADMQRRREAKGLPPVSHFQIQRAFTATILSGRSLEEYQ